MVSEIVFTPAEQAYLARQRGVRRIFNRARRLNTPEVRRLVAELPTVDAKDYESALKASAELADTWGRTDEQKRAADQVSGCLMSSYNIELQAEADHAGIEYPLWNGPNYPAWEALSERAGGFAAALIVFEHLAPEEREFLTVPGLIDEP